jgi:hypothetical protein
VIRKWLIFSRQRAHPPTTRPHVIAVFLPTASHMTESQFLQEFEALAHRMAIPISREDLMGGSGGLCSLRGVKRIILDYRLDVPTQVDILARAFSGLPLDDIFLKPSLRVRIENATNSPL